MRTQKLLTIGLVVGFLLLPMMTIAQDATPQASPVAMESAAFTGGATCGFGVSNEEWLATDPRVTGSCSLNITHEADTVPGGSNFVAIGEYTVNGPEGDWIGTWSLMAFYPTLGRNFILLEGTEAYEGWSVWAWANTPDDWRGEPFDLIGVIYEGSAPEFVWEEPTDG